MLPITRQGNPLREVSVEPSTLTIENGGDLWTERAFDGTHLHISLLVDPYTEEYMHDDILITEEEADTLEEWRSNKFTAEPDQKTLEVLSTINYSIAARCRDSELDPRYLSDSPEGTRIQPQARYSSYELSREEQRYYENYGDSTRSVGGNTHDQITNTFHRWLSYEKLSSFRELQLIRQAKYSLDGKAATAAADEVVGSNIRWIIAKTVPIISARMPWLSSDPDILTEIVHGATVKAYTVLKQNFKPSMNNGFTAYLGRPITTYVTRELKKLMKISSEFSMDEADHQRGEEGQSDSVQEDTLYKKSHRDPRYNNDPSQEAKIELQMLLDRYGRYFTPLQIDILKLAAQGLNTVDTTSRLGTTRSWIGLQKQIAMNRITNLVNGTVDLKDRATIVNFMKRKGGFSEEQIEIMELRATGVKMSQIPAQLGIPESWTREQVSRAMGIVEEMVG